MKAIIIVLVIASTLLAGCAGANQSTNPAWVDKLIEKFKSDPVGNPPLSVWSYEYNGQQVYFVPAHCCDIPSMVYDDSGSFICSPDGGIKGTGDGKCDDFFTSRTGEQLVWKDSR